MTGRRTRLARLEAQHGGGEQTAGRFEADVTAGLWREIGGARTFTLELDLLEGESVGVLLFNPRGGSKIFPGIEDQDL